MQCSFQLDEEEELLGRGKYNTQWRNNVAMMQMGVSKIDGSKLTDVIQELLPRDIE